MKITIKPVADAKAAKAALDILDQAYAYFTAETRCAAKHRKTADT